MKELLKTLVAGWTLCVGWVPKSVKPVRPATHFWAMLVLSIAVSFLWQSWQLREQSRVYSADGLLSSGFNAVLILGVCTLILTRLGKSMLAFSMASLLLSAQLLLASLWVLAMDYLGVRDNSSAGFVMLFWLYAMIWTLTCMASLRFLNAGVSFTYRLGLAVLLAAGTLWPHFGPAALDLPRYVYFDEQTLLNEETALAPPQRSFDAEAVMYAQRSMVEKALSELHTGSAENPDLFVVAMAGDGAENTFLNEVVYAQQLFERRFNARGKTLVLANHPRTTQLFPLASLSNLRAVLKGVAARMDLEQDILFLFLTSHGSAEHEFSLQLEPLPLNQITPDKLAKALNDAGIRRRVILVSACYSGGFIEDLAGPYTVVMSAARADRSSFGCGGDFDMSYFGRAYLLEALNQQKDFLKAFQIAESRIAERELDENQLASLPQMRIGEHAPAMLAQWKRTFVAGEPVPFFVAESQLE